MPNPNFRRWTSDDISILKKMAQTHPMAQIAEQLGRSPSAIAFKAYEMRTHIENASLQHPRPMR